MRSQEERFALLRKWKNEINLTYADIASTADVPVSTVQKIIEGTTKDPAFASVAPIVIALGHTLDEYFGVKTEDSKDVTMYSLMQASYESLLREKDIVLKMTEEKYEDRIKTINEKYAKENENNEKSKKYLKTIILVLGSALAIFFLCCMVISFYLLYQTSPGMQP